jgi:putative N6-adenine-specific DNA methylase
MENQNEIRSYVAKTFSGLENELATELKFLGAENIEIIKRGVKFEGNKELLYRANYLLRTAIRILTPITEFRVTDEQSLYDGVKAIQWDEIMTHKHTFVMTADVFHSQIDHSHFAALKAKDALVDFFRDKIRRRPSVDKDDADIFINIHISQNVCTVSLDSSGESLHKRGYRIGADKAPLNEVLAAGLIKLSGWKGDVDFYDPMCGSGTIVMEAAMIAMNIPAGYYRDKYAFEKWTDFDAELWRSIKEEHDNEFKDIDIKIVASDRSEKAVQIAKRNLKHAGLHKDIEISKAYFDSIVPRSEKGMLMFNPPYGMRLTENDIVQLYQEIGDVLKSNWAGHQAWIITSALDAAKFIGLRPSKRIELYNGPIEARLLCFDLYEGSRKEKSPDYRKKEDTGSFRTGKTKYESKPRPYRREENDYDDLRSDDRSYDKRRSENRSYGDRGRDDKKAYRGGGRYDNNNRRDSRDDRGYDKKRSDNRSYGDRDQDNKKPYRGGGRYDNDNRRDNRDDKRKADKPYGDKRRTFDKEGSGSKPFRGNDKGSYKKRDERPEKKRDSKKVTVRFKRKRLD